MFKKRISFTYETNNGIPYRWTYDIEDEDIVELFRIHKKDYSKTRGRGAKLILKYVFKGLKAGTTAITFKYISLKDDSVTQEYRHIVTVDDKLNITLND